MSRPRVVIVGGGFGGLSAVLGLRGAKVDITVIDQRNYHLFQPLLYQVATAGLSPAEIAAPIRSILHQANVSVVLGRVTGVDLERRVVLVDTLGFREAPYDTLVLATGARHSYFGHDEWEAFAPGLKTVEDATAIRRRILLAFELAENEPDPAERAGLLTFVVIGGGPTGVEMAGAIAELARRILSRDFRTIAGERIRVLLIEAGPRLLPTFPPDLSAYTQRALARLGVETLLGSAVTDVASDHVALGTKRIETRTAIWAAGVTASEAALWLGAEADRSGRVKVTDRLTVPGHDEVYVIGDTALARDAQGRPVPGVAPAAKQEGAYVARAVRLRLEGRAPPPFRYRDLGSLATIGRRAAAIAFGRVHLTGLLAWLLWGAAHIFFLIGFRNRVVVLLDWLWAYVRFGGGARLITAAPDARLARPSEPT